MYSEPVRSKNDKLYIWTLGVFVGLVVVSSSAMVIREILKSPMFYDHQVVTETQNDEMVAEVLGESETHKTFPSAKIITRETTSNGNTIAVGRIRTDEYEVIDVDVSFGEELIGVEVGDHILITSHNEFGGLNWYKLLNSQNFDRLYSKVLQDSSIFLAGEFENQLVVYGSDFEIKSIGGIDVYMIKIDVFGNLVMFEGQGTKLDDRLGTVQIDSFGNPKITTVEN